MRALFRVRYAYVHRKRYKITKKIPHLQVLWDFFSKKIFYFNILLKILTNLCTFCSIRAGRCLSL